MPSSDKFTRWIDLIAALLVRTRPATFDELANEVPEYAAKRVEIAAADSARRKTLEDSLKRTFERDKQELKTFGVPIESTPDEDGNPSGAYLLKRTNFYLPYLCVALPHEPTPAVAKLDKFGYKALSTLRFEPDELQAVVDAAGLVRSLGDPILAADATNALRKLAVDLPVDASLSAAPDSNAGTASPHIVLPRARANAAVFEALSDALHRKKRVTFRYHALSSDQATVRTVEPYGLFFLNGHWYLVGRDVDVSELRNFRLNRVADPQVNTAKSLSADYDVPGTFRLRDHAASRQAWELGDDDVITVVAEFHLGADGASASAQLGAPVDGAPTQRAFSVRRVEPFVRWALSNAGEMTLVSPAEVCAQLAREAAATRALYTTPADPVDHRDWQRPAPVSQAPGSTHWQPKGAAAQLQRILNVVPQLADGDDHPIADVATSAGADAQTLMRDLQSLVYRYDLPGGFNEGVRLYIESDRVSAATNHLLRPMRLTVSELCALELGLAMLHAQRPPSEHRVLEQARARLRKIIAQLPTDPIPDAALHPPVHASLGSPANVDALGVLRQAITTQQRVRITYRKSGSEHATPRDICPYALIASNGMLYVVGFCTREEDLRVFRLDRIQSAVALDVTFERPTDFVLEEVVTDGRVFQGEATDTLVIRYSSRIARWIAEREGVVLADDGSLTMAYPLADAAWAARFVLQYGAEAEVLSPASMREALRAQLGAMALS